MKSRPFYKIVFSLICVALLTSLSMGGVRASISPTHDEVDVSDWTLGPKADRGPGDGLRIRLAAGTFDPLVDSGAPHLPDGLGLTSYPGDGTGYYLVQFTGPIAASDRNALEATGAEVFDYIPDFTFIVKMDDVVRARVASLRSVRWVGLYQPAYRLPADLLALASDGKTALISSHLSEGREAQADFWSDDPIELLVVIFRGEALAPFIDQVETWGGTVLDHSQTAWKSKLRITLAPSRLDDLVALSGVRWVEEAPEWELANNEAIDVIGVREVWDTHGLYGDGQTIAVCDTGLDQGSTAPGSLHDDFEDGSGSSRVLHIYDLVGDGANDVNSGHGTHVAGSVLGNGARSGATPSSHTYPDSAYVGAAPEASLVFQAVENNSEASLSGIPLDLTTLFSQADSGGADLHTNSWGSSVMGMYTSSSEEVDEYIWDHPEFTILFAAGNSGIDSNADGVVDFYSMGSPATAKNAVTVGATENNRPAIGDTWNLGWPTSYPVNPIKDDRMADDASGLAAFSSRGPALDGRYKPDIVAPGTFIASVRSSVASSSGWGAIDSYYMYMGGTSMATPLAAGTATLVREFYTDRGMTPSAALIKATLVNGASDIYPGQYGTGSTQEIPGSRPTNVAGWGRVDLGNSLFPEATRMITYSDVAVGLDTGESDTYNYIVTDSAEPLRTTLAWSDYPGSPSAAGGLVNDLDLKVTGPDGSTYYPNNASQRGDSQHLAYDDGVYDGGYYGSAGDRVAVRFTPTSYPVTLQTGLFYLASNSSSYPKMFNWYVYDGSDATGPQSELASGSTTIRRMGWHAVDLSGEGVTISSGDFFLVIELPDDDLVWLYDSNSPNGRSWTYGGSWSKNTSEDYMFNAIVTGADASTSQDRVNNLVGIDIEAPDPGTYTVTVSGYNVPQGPQPYALVASGAITTVAPAPVPNVGISKEVVGDDFAPGDGITFTLDVANSGTLTATNVVVTDAVPSEVLSLSYASTLAITPTGAISFVWDVEPLEPGESGVITVYGQIDPSLADGFSFTNRATVSDLGDETPGNNTSSVGVGERTIYLPLVMKVYPPVPATPVLNAINNGDGDGSYTVNWNAAERAETYLLQEDDNASFSSPSTAYSGSGTSASISGKPTGTYYYRVKAISSWEGKQLESGWSNARSVTVQPPSGPQPGFWEGGTDPVEFYVTTDRAYVDDFAVYIGVTGCGNYRITHSPRESISNDQFSFSGSFYASGTFNSPTTASGATGLDNFYISGCGFISGGPWPWSAVWTDSTQPSAPLVKGVRVEAAEPAKTDNQFYTVTPIE